MVSILFLSACGSMTDSWLPDKKVAYKKEKQAQRSLEVPPDLTATSISDELLVPDLDTSSAAAVAQYQKTQTPSASTVLPKVKHVKMVKEGDKRWLVIDGNADTVWQSVIDFWQNNGVLLVEQDPVIGVMRTNWLENRATIDSGIISNTIRSVFDGAYSSSTRDQYRVRIEDLGKKGQVELFLTHFGMEEDIVQSQSGDSEQPVWQAKGSDPELEAIMLRKIMVYLGVDEKRAQAESNKAAKKTNPLSQLIKGNEVALMINEDADRAWRLVGIALERVGLAVEDRKPDEGIYMVRYYDPTAEDNKGFFASVAFWRKEEAFDSKKLYQIILGSDGKGGVKTTVADEAGERLNNKTAIRILTLVQEQLK